MPLDPSITLQPHQERVRDEAAAAAAADQPFRKLLYWRVGAGKGPGSIAAAEALGAPYTAVVPAALRPTFQGEIGRFTDNSTPASVLSYNQAARGSVPPPETLLADEAHRLGSANSAQAKAVAELAAKAKNVILMTGTPVRNSPAEMAALVSILSGKHITPEEFAKNHIGTEKISPGFLGRLRGIPPVEQPALVNTEELKHLLDGKVDYFEPANPPVEVRETEHEVELSPRQAELIRGIWQDLPVLLRWKLKNRYDLSPGELKRFQAFMTGPRQAALSDYTFRTDGDALGAFHSSGKLTKAYELLKARLDSDPRTKAVVFSNYPQAGLIPYAHKLRAEGVPHAIFDGKLSDVERKDIAKKFNENQLRVLLLGPAAAEGLSLRGAQLAQLLDAHWNDARLRQAAARVIRFDSHKDLPPELQQVEVQKFIGKLPLGLKDRLLARLGVDRESQRRTVDDYLRDVSEKKTRLNHQMLILLREVAEHNRGKSASERVYLGDVVKEAGLKASEPVLSEREDLDDPAEPLHRFDLHQAGPSGASEAGKNIGYLTSHPATEGGVWLKGMKVDPAHRGRGMAKTLLEAALAKYQGQDLRLRAKPYDDEPLDAAALQKFYGRYGFVPYDDEGRMVRKATPQPTPGDSERLAKLSALVPQAGEELLAQLRKAKEFSDLETPEGYAQKQLLLRSLISRSPGDWTVDSWLHYPKFVGVRHNKSGWQYHLPASAVGDLLPLPPPHPAP